MALSPRNRFRLIRDAVQEITDAPESWTTTTLNILLKQYGLGTIYVDVNETAANEFAVAVGDATDDALLEIHGAILGIADEDVGRASFPSEGDLLWQPGYFRVFLSHSAAEKAFIAEISRELAIFGVHGFVAHESMQIEQSWQTQIELALRTAEAFVGVIHPRFNESAWCHQETGWAYGRALPVFFVRAGADPAGFPSPTQWPSVSGRTAREVAMQIVSWLDRSGALRTPLIDGLLRALSDAPNYFEAEAAAKRIVALGDLPDHAWEKLAQAYWSNDQVYHGVLPTRVLRPFYADCGRDFPPEEPLATPRT